MLLSKTYEELAYFVDHNEFPVDNNSPRMSNNEIPVNTVHANGDGSTITDPNPVNETSSSNAARSVLEHDEQPIRTTYKSNVNRTSPDAPGDSTPPRGPRRYTY